MLEGGRMNKLKRVLKVLAVLLVIWLGFTYYFITQHSVVGKEAKIDKTIVFNDVSIELDSMVLYNFKHKETNFDYGRSDIRYKLLSNLPELFVMPYLKIVYLYSTPYEINNKLYQTALFGKCIFNQHLNESTDYHAYYRDHISINVVDSVGAGYSSGSSTRYEDDSSQEIDFSVSGRDFPIERFQEGMKIIIRHLESGEERELKIDFQDFKTYEHNDSFRKAFPFRKFDS